MIVLKTQSIPIEWYLFKFQTQNESTWNCKRFSILFFIMTYLIYIFTIDTVSSMFTSISSANMETERSHINEFTSHLKIYCL